MASLSKPTASTPRRRGPHPSRTGSVVSSRTEGHTVYETFNTSRRWEFVRITEDVQKAVDEAGHKGRHGAGLGHAHYGGRLVNDDEPGILEDALEWLDKLAPPTWQPASIEVAQKLLPDGGDYRHHLGGKDNADAHLKELADKGREARPTSSQ